MSMSNELGTVPMSTVSIRIPTSTKERVDDLAHAMWRSRDFLLVEAIEQYLELQARHLAHIEEGIADLEAGRVHTHEEMQDLVRDFERLAQDDADGKSGRGR